MLISLIDVEYKKTRAFRQFCYYWDAQSMRVIGQNDPVRQNCVFLVAIPVMAATVDCNEDNNHEQSKPYANPHLQSFLVKQSRFSNIILSLG